jgi:hypothetical protein
MIRQPFNQKVETREGKKKSYEVCVSFEPENMITSAGDVLVIRVLSRAVPELVTFLKSPMAVVVTPPISPLLYESNALNRSSAASLARLGSFKTPYGTVKPVRDQCMLSDSYLGRVYKRQIQRRPRMTRVKDCCQSNSREERFHPGES